MKKITKNSDTCKVLDVFSDITHDILNCDKQPKKYTIIKDEMPDRDLFSAASPTFNTYLKDNILFITEDNDINKNCTKFDAPHKIYRGRACSEDYEYYSDGQYCKFHIGNISASKQIIEGSDRDCEAIFSFIDW